MMEMIEIEAFVDVARTGGFTRAAAALHVSQPAISRRIELLERELGTPLFDRVREGARLTDAGRAFLPHAERVLAAVRDGAAAVREVAHGERGSVALTIVGTLANGALPARLRAFRGAHPGIDVRLRTARSAEVSELVRQGAVSLGLRYFPDPSPEIVSIHVDDEAMVVACAADSRFTPPDATDAAALAGAPWVGFPIGSGSSGKPFARLLERQLVRVGLELAEFVAVDSLTAQKRLIEADFGVGLLPASSIEEEVRLGTIRVLAMPALAVSAPVHVLHRRAGHCGPAAQRLLAALAGHPAAGA